MKCWLGAIPAKMRWNILVVGDSHMASILLGLQSMAFDYNFDLYPMPAVSAKVFSTDKEKRREYTARVEDFKADMGIIMLGGVDCEFVAPLKYTNDIHPFVYIEETARNYAKFLDNDMKTPMLVIGILPPVLTDNNYFNILMREYGIQFTKKTPNPDRLNEITLQLQSKPFINHETRKKLHIHFNNTLRANLKRHKFLSFS